MPQAFIHPRFTRRTALQAGAIGLLGLGTNHLAALRAMGGPSAKTARAKTCICVFLSGGLAQQDSFDLKPNAPAEIRGEFKPIPTATPGIQICEHLPMLAQRSQHWSLVRSLTHTNNGHDVATYLMLTGRSQLPSSFRASRPQGTDFPSIAAIAGAMTRRRGIWPGSAVLPEKIYHSNTGIYPGQFAGLLGSRHEPWFLEMTDKPHAYHAYSGAFPTYLFDLHKGEPSDRRDWRFEVPNLTLPEGALDPRHRRRMDLLAHIEGQQRRLDSAAAVAGYDRVRQSA